MHLTDEQIDDRLIGDLAPEAEAHLAACEACRQRVAASEAPIASFREMSLAWAERRSATMPLRVATPQPERHRSLWASMGAIAAAALAFSVALPHLLHPNTTPAVTTIASAEQIAQDNAMLDAIDHALNAPIEMPPSTQTGQHHGRARANLMHD